MLKSISSIFLRVATRKFNTRCVAYILFQLDSADLKACFKLIVHMFLLAQVLTIMFPNKVLHEVDLAWSCWDNFEYVNFLLLYSIKFFCLEITSSLKTTSIVKTTLVPFTQSQRLLTAPLLSLLYHVFCYHYCGVFLLKYLRVSGGLPPLYPE